MRVLITNFVVAHLTAIHLSVTFDGVVFTSLHSDLTHGYRAMQRWTAFVCPLIGLAKEPST